MSMGLQFCKGLSSLVPKYFPLQFLKCLRASSNVGALLPIRWRLGKGWGARPMHLITADKHSNLAPKWLIIMKLWNISDFAPRFKCLNKSSPRISTQHHSVCILSCLILTLIEQTREGNIQFTHENGIGIFSNIKLKKKKKENAEICWCLALNYL